jgi:hypothetical protein
MKKRQKAIKEYLAKAGIKVVAFQMAKRSGHMRLLLENNRFVVTSTTPKDRGSFHKIKQDCRRELARG